MAQGPHVGSNHLATCLEREKGKRRGGAAGEHGRPVWRRVDGEQRRARVGELDLPPLPSHRPAQGERRRHGSGPPSTGGASWGPRWAPAPLVMDKF